MSDFKIFVEGEGVENTELNEISNQFAGQAELAYRTLQANDVYTNGPNIATDEFIYSSNITTSTNGTAKYAESTADYDSTNDLYRLAPSDEASGDTTHDPDSFTNPSNAFDGDRTTFARKSTAGDSFTYRLGKTFAAKNVEWVSFNVQNNLSSISSFTIDTYNGSTWSTAHTLSTAVTGRQIGFFQIGSSVQGIAVKFTYGATGGTKNMDVYHLEYGDLSTSSSLICDSTGLTLDGTEKGAVVFADMTNTANTSITVKAGDGTTQTAAQSINATSQTTNVFDISSLSSGTLELEFTLATTNTTETPTISGYGVRLIR